MATLKHMQKKDVAKKILTQKKVPKKVQHQKSLTDSGSEPSSSWLKIQHTDRYTKL